jgi:hypothetical protein
MDHSRRFRAAPKKSSSSPITDMCQQQLKHWRHRDPNTLSVHQHNLGTLFATLYPAQNKAGASRGICSASIDNLAGRSEPSASLSGPWPQGLAPVSSRCAAALRFRLGRRGGAKPTVFGKEQLLSVVCRFSCPGCQRSGWAKSAARATGAPLRDKRGWRSRALFLCRTTALRLHLRRHPTGL